MAKPYRRHRRDARILDIVFGKLYKRILKTLKRLITRVFF